MTDAMRLHSNMGNQAEYPSEPTSRGVQRHPNRYPGDVVRRNVDEETPFELGGVELFDEEIAISINQGRLDHLASLEMSIARKRVLDVGCGVGHLSRYFAALGCELVCVDIRLENVKELKRRHPGTEAHVVDIETDDLSSLGVFDIVFCYGLLYHLENPVAALRKLRSACRGQLILETIVCDSSEPVMKLADEPLTSNQAKGGTGCRPSPSFVAFALNRVGFRHVYQPINKPEHSDFLFEWKNDFCDKLDDHPIRCVFVASTVPLENENRIDFLLPR